MLNLSVTIPHSWSMGVARGGALSFRVCKELVTSSTAAKVGWREGRREGGREGRREGGRDGGREGGREGGRGGSDL